MKQVQATTVDKIYIVDSTEFFASKHRFFQSYFLGTFAELRPPVCRSVRLSAWNNSAPTERIFMKFDIWLFLEKLPRNVKFHYKRTIITGTIHEHHWAFLIIYR